MVADALELQIRRRLQEGLPLVARPYQQLANELCISEQQVIDKITELKERGLIKRFGMVLRHHELGYVANCMVVWNVPDEDLEQVAAKLAQQDCVTLCYQRPRRPGWPYNLFCMIHAKQRADVEQKLAAVIQQEGLDYPHQLLFSTRRFKQRGARYV